MPTNALQNIQLSDLLDLPITSARGKAKKDSGIVYLRDLDESDVPAFGQSVGAVIRPLVRIRQRHHNLAQLIATGISHAECSAITGYGQSSISILLQDPAFQELVEYYTSQKKEVFLDVQQRLAEVGIAALEEIRDRLEENPGGVSMQQLESLIKTVFDRSVAPVKGTGQAHSGGAGTAVSVTVEFVQPKTAPGPILDLQVNEESK